MSQMSARRDSWYGGKRTAGLLRFAIAISILNVLGHTLFGFEQAWAHPLIALATAYGVELVLEIADAWANHRRPMFLRSGHDLVVFLLPAHITGLAVSMLLYPNERFWVVAFASAVAIASKRVFRIAVQAAAAGGRGARARHFFNPSNIGIVFTLLLFPSVGIAPPYQFTENLRGPLDVILPLLIVVSGSFVNVKFTERVPLILAWLGVFALQAVVRSWLHELPWQAALTPMTGLAFVLFTFYMVTDPGTTPAKAGAQIIFGSSVALVYGILMTAHVVFGLFFSLAVVTAVRGLGMYWSAVRVSVLDRAPAGVAAR